MEREEFNEWLSNPTTVEVFEFLRKARDTDATSLLDGNTLSVDPGETAQLTARIVGKIQGINQLLNISYEDEGD